MHTRSSACTPARGRLPLPSREFLCRASLVALIVTSTHQLNWWWLRFVTSESTLRLSSLLGMQTQRISFDTVRIHGQIVSFVISCTFIDVIAGAVPLLWDFRKPLISECSRMLVCAFVLFACNLVRLEIAQLLYAVGVPWTVADDILGGFAYFAVWLFIWHHRTWKLMSA